jgi:hypothetical protein
MRDRLPGKPAERLELHAALLAPDPHSHYFPPGLQADEDVACFVDGNCVRHHLPLRLVLDLVPGLQGGTFADRSGDAINGVPQGRVPLPCLPGPEMYTGSCANPVRLHFLAKALQSFRDHEHAGGIDAAVKPLQVFQPRS